MLGLENEIEVLVPSKPPRIKKQIANEKQLDQDREDLSDMSGDISDDIQRENGAQDEND